MPPAISAVPFDAATRGVSGVGPPDGQLFSSVPGYSTAESQHWAGSQMANPGRAALGGLSCDTRVSDRVGCAAWHIGAFRFPGKRHVPRSPLDGGSRRLPEGSRKRVSPCAGPSVLAAGESKDVREVSYFAGAISAKASRLGSFHFIMTSVARAPMHPP